MFVSTLNKDTPASSSFTIAERTLVQGCILGDSVLSGGELVQVQVFDGTEYKFYRLTIGHKSPEDLYLAAGTYRAYLEGADSDSEVSLMFSPVVSD